jgi:hypothetical protein
VSRLAFVGSTGEIGVREPGPSSRMLLFDGLALDLRGRPVLGLGPYGEGSSIFEMMVAGITNVRYARTYHPINYFDVIDVSTSCVSLLSQLNETKKKR